MHRPFNLKLDELTAFNIANRDRTITQLRRELKERKEQLRDAQTVTIHSAYHQHTIKPSQSGNQYIEEAPCESNQEKCWKMLAAQSWDNDKTTFSFIYNYPERIT